MRWQAISRPFESSTNPLHALAKSAVIRSVEGDRDTDRNPDEALEQRTGDVDAGAVESGPIEDSTVGAFAAQYKAHSGPLPSQEWFAGLEAIHPGATEIVLRDFTEERKHQRRMQEKAFGLDREVFLDFSSYQKSRLRLAGMLALFIAAGGLALVLLDRAVYGFVLLIAEITGLMGVFLVGKALADEDGSDLDDVDEEQLDRLLAEAEEEPK